MSDNPKKRQKAVEGQVTDQQSKRQEFADKMANSNDVRQLAIRSLLEISPVGVDDKLTTVKAAHHVDKERFQSAFRIFMGNAKS